MNTARKTFWEKFYQNPHSHVSEVYESRGEVHRLVSMYDKALYDFGKCLAINEILNDNKRKAKFISQIGNVCLHKSDFEKAEIKFNQSLEIYKSILDSGGMAYCYQQLGKTFQYKEKFKEADELYNQAFEIYKELNEENGINAVLLNKADNFLSIGKYNEALNLTEKTIFFFYSNKNKINLLRAYQTYGKAMRELGNHVGSIEYLNKAVSLSREIGEKGSMVHLLCDIGLEYYSRGDYVQAKELFIESYNLALQQNMTFMNAVSILNIGDVCQKMGDNVAALTYLHKVRSLDLNIVGIKDEAERLIEVINSNMKGGEIT